MKDDKKQSQNSEVWLEMESQWFIEYPLNVLKNLIQRAIISLFKYGVLTQSEQEGHCGWRDSHATLYELATGRIDPGGGAIEMGRPVAQIC